jgi:hypothetical protein
MVQVQSTFTVEAERFTPEGEVGRYRFPPMTVAQVAIRGGIDLERCDNPTGEGQAPRIPQWP